MDIDPCDRLRCELSTVFGLLRIYYANSGIAGSLDVGEDPATLLVDRVVIWFSSHYVDAPICNSPGCGIVCMPGSVQVDMKYFKLPHILFLMFTFF